MIDEIRKFIIDELDKMKFDVSVINGQTSFGPAGLDLESLAIASLAVQIEDRFGVKIDEDEMERIAMMTIDQIAAEIARRYEEQAAG